MKGERETFEVVPAVGLVGFGFGAVVGHWAGLHVLGLAEADFGVEIAQGPNSLVRATTTSGIVASLHVLAVGGWAGSVGAMAVARGKTLVAFLRAVLGLIILFAAAPIDDSCAAPELIDQTGCRVASGLAIGTYFLCALYGLGFSLPRFFTDPSARRPRT